MEQDTGRCVSPPWERKRKRSAEKQEKRFVDCVKWKGLKNGGGAYV